MVGYLTRRNELMRQLEARCIEPGRWHVEGHEVTKERRGWAVNGVLRGKGLGEALEWIAEEYA